jgi:Ni,Fe-hydrogenase I cytochrome b subunit
MVKSPQGVDMKIICSFSALVRMILWITVIAVVAGMVLVGSGHRIVTPGTGSAESDYRSVNR